MSSESTMDFIPTRGSAGKRKAATNFNSIDYKSHKSKKVNSGFAHSVNTTELDQQSGSQVAPINVFNIKKVKHEVIKFGMSGFSNKERKEARVELAIKLGAKPERRRCINYKQLKRQRQTELEQLRSQSDFLQLGKNSIGKSTAKGKSFDKKRKGNADIINHYGIVKPADRAEIRKARETKTRINKRSITKK